MAVNVRRRVPSRDVDRAYFQSNEYEYGNWWLWAGNIETYHDRPEIVTLCGSTRFVDQFNEWRKRLTHQGCIVLSIEIVTSQQYDEDPQHVNRANKEMLDLLHLEKIRISDRVLVLNVNGYIGESTALEAKYAETIGVPVEYAYPE